MNRKISLITLLHPFWTFKRFVQPYFFISTWCRKRGRMGFTVKAHKQFSHFSLTNKITSSRTFRSFLFILFWKLSNFFVFCREIFQFQCPVISYTFLINTHEMRPEWEIFLYRKKTFCVRYTNKNFHFVAFKILSRLAKQKHHTAVDFYSISYFS